MKRNISVILIFALLTIFMTYPLTFKIKDHIPGFFSTDEPSVWYLWWLRYAEEKGISSAFCPLISAPFGLDFSIIERLLPLWTMFRKTLVKFADEFLAYNIEILLSFLLSGFFVYLLVKYLLGSKLAAIFSGLIYAFCPYHFARAWQHVSLSNIQWMPLYILALFKLKEKVGLKNIVFSVLALFVVASFDFYYLYFMLVVTGLFIVFNLIYYKKASLRVNAAVILSTIFTLAILSALIFPALREGLIRSKELKPGPWGFVRPFEDLFSQSAKPLSYFLPSAQHPIFGNFTQMFVGSKLYGMSFTEHALYLGWVPIILAFIAFKKWKRGRKLAVRDKEDFYIGFFLFLVILSWLFSQPPWWNVFNFKLYMPSFFMYRIIPLFRAYCRFGIVVMLAVSVLAGFGLKIIIDKTKTRQAKTVISVLFSALVLFEFLNFPPFKVLDFSKYPGVYDYLNQRKGDFTVAEYPLDTEGPNETYKFYQTKHEKKIINGTTPGTYANRVAKIIVRLSDPTTAEVLKWMGVKYVLVHKEDYLKTELLSEIEELGRIPQNPGLKFVKNFGDEIDLYEINSQRKTDPATLLKSP